MGLPSGAIIRHAVREDVSTILHLIRELADYEKALSSVQATEESLLASLTFAPSITSAPSETPLPISSSRPATTLLAFTPSGEVAGMALYFYNYSTWRSVPGVYLEDLYVTPTVRGEGYGKALLKAVARETRRIGGARLEWCVLKWNTPSIDFYVSEAVGARRMEEWVGMRVEGEKLEKLGAEEES